MLRSNCCGNFLEDNGSLGCGSDVVPSTYENTKRISSIACIILQPSQESWGEPKPRWKKFTSKIIFWGWKIAQSVWNCLVRRRKKGRNHVMTMRNRPIFSPKILDLLSRTGRFSTQCLEDLFHKLVLPTKCVSWKKKWTFFFNCW